MKPAKNTARLLELGDRGRAAAVLASKGTSPPQCRCGATAPLLDIDRERSHWACHGCGASGWLATAPNGWTVRVRESRGAA